MSKALFCTGENCPDKKTCSLFFGNYDGFVFDKTKEDHFAEPPYDHSRTKPYKSTGTNCGYYESFDPTDIFLKS